MTEVEQNLNEMLMMRREKLKELILIKLKNMTIPIIVLK